eukprot:gene36922-44794_t
MTSRLSRLLASTGPGLLVSPRLPNAYLSLAHFGRVAGGRRKKPTVASEETALTAPPPAALDADPWVPVTDKASGQIYFWNTQTNETTALGAPKPTSGTLAHPQPPQQGGMLKGLGSVVAEGFAFGTGSAIAHNVVGSFFGGGGHSNDSGGGDAGGGDEWDI